MCRKYSLTLVGDFSFLFLASAFPTQNNQSIAHLSSTWNNLTKSLHAGRRGVCQPRWLMFPPGLIGLCECWYKLSIKMKRHVRILIFRCPLTVRCVTAFYMFSTNLSTSDPSTRRTASLYLHRTMIVFVAQYCT
ncbi:hypothetical protein CY34DRAFT_219057 [Suillus luteus UH-Slu-Lm8-n1]|uniref:Secreted protein n=1 Tax=Suillus luteus UH-Slu-Lm8-n1 TaxID=930992 RepID=A0A0D0B426_9AGAM|nr:hypothetical protein CY34DRAFT_219057 [Suillus luteus UH-Slu-Lm8-n1]